MGSDAAMVSFLATGFVKNIELPNVCFYLDSASVVFYFFTPL